MPRKADESLGVAQRTCPSSPAAPGAVLLGIAGPSGRIGYLTPPIRVDESLLEDLRADGPPEQRMRFADRCQTSACIHWSGSACSLVDRVIQSAEAAVDETPDADGDDALPMCSIRASCRWFAQRSRAACAVCPLVLTDRSAH